MAENDMLAQMDHDAIRQFLTALVTSDYPDLADESEDKLENDMLAQMDHDAIRQFLKGQGYDVHKHRSAKAAISQANGDGARRLAQASLCQGGHLPGQ